MKYKLDILAVVAHPDDAELGCGGTLIKAVNEGKKVGIIDLTQGELGSRGNELIRAEEAKKAALILKLSARENLFLPDGFFSDNYGNQIKIVEVIRRYRPDVVLTNAISDRHPDHKRAGDMVSRACFLSGLRKVETKDNDKWQEHWRPKHVFRFVQDRYVEPDFLVDISAEWEVKMKAIMAFSSQFYQKDEESTKPQTPISSEDFVRFLEARSREFGRNIGVSFAEGFTCERTIGVKSIFELI